MTTEKEQPRVKLLWDRFGNLIEIRGEKIVFSPISIRGIPQKLLTMLCVNPGEITTPLFWDCECKSDYIHPRMIDKCEICKRDKWDQPDSRYIEVITMIIGAVAPFS